MRLPTDNGAACRCNGSVGWHPSPGLLDATQREVQVVGAAGEAPRALQCQVHRLLQQGQVHGAAAHLQGRTHEQEACTARSGCQVSHDTAGPAKGVGRGDVPSQSGQLHPLIMESRRAPAAGVCCSAGRAAHPRGAGPKVHQLVQRRVGPGQRGEAPLLGLPVLDLQEENAACAAGPAAKQKRLSGHQYRRAWTWLQAVRIISPPGP